MRSHSKLVAMIVILLAITFSVAVVAEDSQQMERNAMEEEGDDNAEIISYGSGYTLNVAVGGGGGGGGGIRYQSSRHEPIGNHKYQNYYYSDPYDNVNYRYDNNNNKHQHQHYPNPTIECGIPGAFCCDYYKCHVPGYECMRFESATGDSIYNPTCQLCGLPDHPCCSNQHDEFYYSPVISEACQSGSVCNWRGVCQECGGEDEPCCSGDECNDNLECEAGDICAIPCGEVGEICCDSSVPCEDGGVCSDSGATSGTCVECGGPSQLCCVQPGTGSMVCDDGSACLESGFCPPCEKPDGFFNLVAVGDTNIFAGEGSGGTFDECLTSADNPEFFQNNRALLHYLLDGFQLPECLNAPNGGDIVADVRNSEFVGVSFNFTQYAQSMLNLAMTLDGDTIDPPSRRVILSGAASTPDLSNVKTYVVIMPAADSLVSGGTLTQTGMDLQTVLQNCGRVVIMTDGSSFGDAINQANAFFGMIGSALTITGATAGARPSFDGSAAFPPDFTLEEICTGSGSTVSGGSVVGTYGSAGDVVVVDTVAL